MAYKPLWDFMDKHEGRKIGSSTEALDKEKKRQGVAGKMDTKKRWGNSAQKGLGVNSPAMMEARNKFDKQDKQKDATKGIE